MSGLVDSSSICAKHWLLQLKILHRIHYTSARLAKMFSSVSDACNRCEQSPGTLMHMRWTCPRLSHYWTEIFKTLQDAYDVTMEPNPTTAIFGIPPELNKPISLLAQRLILLKWRHVTPTHTRWIMEVLQCIKLEKITFATNYPLKTFNMSWKTFFG